MRQLAACYGADPSVRGPARPDRCGGWHVSELRAEQVQILPPPTDVHVIESPEHLGPLGRINLIAYERLRMPVRREASRRVTYNHLAPSHSAAGCR